MVARSFSDRHYLTIFGRASLLACHRPPRQHTWLPYRPGNEQKTTPNGQIFREVDQLPLEGRRTCG